LSEKTLETKLKNEIIMPLSTTSLTLLLIFSTGILKQEEVDEDSKGQTRKKDQIYFLKSTKHKRDILC
jgi:hypothetical protein